MPSGCMSPALAFFIVVAISQISPQADKCKLWEMEMLGKGEKGERVDH